MSYRSDNVSRPNPYTGPVPAAEQAHYDALRQARGWSWETLAGYFDAQRSDPASPRLAKWARSQAEAEPVKAKRGAERADADAPEKRG